jgi:phosphomannomutase
MIGVSSTPAVCWYGATHGFDCLVAVTASHLAAKYNGFKICRAGAEAICSENGLLEIEALMSEIKAEGVAPPKSLTGKLTDVTDALELYIAAMERFLNVASPLRIVVDAGGSPVGRELARLFQNTEVEVVPLGFELDGGFSRRSANPLDEGALDELSARVVREGARFGAAFDGDADRVVFVDEGGKMIPPDLIIALLAQEMLLKSPGASIMYDLRSSRAVPEAITASGGNPIKCRVGTFIGADMRKQGAVLAGELSAHYYWSELFCADNALKALIELTSLISHVAEPLSQVVKPLMKYVSSGEINFKCTQSKLIIERLAARYEAERIDRLDGLTVEFDDWWFNVRPSQTEPLVRLCLGAADAELLAQRKNDLQKSIEELSGVSA